MSQNVNTKSNLLLLLFKTSDDLVCDDVQIEKVINSEMSGSRLHCVEKHLPPICHPTECRLAESENNKTFCINDNLPKQIDLKGRKLKCRFDWKMRDDSSRLGY